MQYVQSYSSMASPSELSLLECNPQSYSMLLKSFGDNKLEEYLSCLEEERLKIDAFKRELPLCMQLLTNAMEASRQQLQSYKIKRPILEEFIPMKHSESEGEHKALNNTSDKASWMTSAQLWSQANEGATTKQLEQPLPSKELSMEFTPKLSLIEDNYKNQRSCGAFIPFTKERNSTNVSQPDLALVSNEREMDDEKGLKSTEKGFPLENSVMVSNGMAMINGAVTTTTNTTTTAQPNRKQRRCWSPDLHRRFVNALQMLGGSQVATPKQIRELMKVDGLTNDEVKSHLQKYRLHTRRPGPIPQGGGAAGTHLVVLGGIWVPPEYAAAAGHHHHQHGLAPPTIYSPQPTGQVGPFYHALPHHQVQIYKGQSSPESHGRRAARDQSESIEDGKSESSSGEESNERKKMASKVDSQVLGS